MSMGMALYGLQEYLRRENRWTVKQCGVQKNCIPPTSAGQFYVAIDDGGVEASSPDENNYITEIMNIEIGVWRRPSHLIQADMVGKMKLPDDPYLAGILTCPKLERLVLVPTPGQQSGGLDRNYGAMNFINELFALPDPELGASFMEPLRFRGYGRFEGIAEPNTSDADGYLGRRLRFRGLKRIQNPTQLVG